MTTLDLARLYVALYGNRAIDLARYRTMLDFRGVDTTRLEAIARNYARTYRLMCKRSPASWQYERLMQVRARLSDEADGLAVEKPMISIVSLSGGLSSMEALRRTIARRGKENVRAVFADVKGSGKTHFWSTAPFVDDLLHERYGGESRDLYRFLWQVSYHFDIPVERLEDGRSIYTVFAQKRAFRLFSGGGFVHFCSETLKRQQIKKWIEANHKPGEYEIVLGMNWDEAHRVEKAQQFWQHALGWDVKVYSPLIGGEYADNCTISKWCHDNGLDIPASYDNGFAHSNCNNGCIAAGQAHFANLYNTNREAYQYWAYQEQSLNRYWNRDKPATILKDERGGTAKPLSLKDFEGRVKAGDYRKADWGGCGCFVGNRFGVKQERLFADAA